MMVGVSIVISVILLFHMFPQRFGWCGSVLTLIDTWQKISDSPSTTLVPVGEEMLR